MATMEERLAAIEHEQAELKQDQAKLKRDNAELKQNNADLKQKIELHTIALGGLVNKAMLESINEKNDKIFQALMNHDNLTNHQLAEIRERVEVHLEGKIVGLQTEVRQRFDLQDAAMNARFDQITLLLTALAPKPDQEA